VTCPFRLNRWLNSFSGNAFTLLVLLAVLLERFKETFALKLEAEWKYGVLLDKEDYHHNQPFY